MTRTELSRFQKILAAKQFEISRATTSREGLAIERTPDEFDAVQLASERELTSRGLDRHSKLLRDLRAALQRVAEGSYGTCLECEEEISSKRLNAVPWATLCIACQERKDRNYDADFEPLPRAA